MSGRRVVDEIRHLGVGSLARLGRRLCICAHAVRRRVPVGDAIAALPRIE